MTRQQAKKIALAVVRWSQPRFCIHGVVRERVEDCDIGELVRKEAFPIARHGEHALVPVRPSVTYDFGKFGDVTFATSVQTYEFAQVTYGVIDKNGLIIERHYWKRVR